MITYEPYLVASILEVANPKMPRIGEDVGLQDLTFIRFYDGTRVLRTGVGYALWATAFNIPDCRNVHEEVYMSDIELVLLNKEQLIIMLTDKIHKAISSMCKHEGPWGAD